ncbi:MAG: DNA/RNA non-specific endonuclease [Treponema sp.]|nr:DNA/RNA non-specific endonuclease [Treponema sp.]
MRFKRRNNKKALLFFAALFAAVAAWAQVALPPGLEIPRCPGNAAAFDCADDQAVDQPAELSDGLGAGLSSCDQPADNGQPAAPDQEAGASADHQAVDTPAAPDHQIRAFQYYTICYRKSYEQAEWSAYCLRDWMLQKNAKRTNDFRPDPQIAGGSATLADYKKSGYDRGHLTPAGDMVFSREAMSETFYMSNMCPQAAAFNRGIWKDLEDQVREWVRLYGAAYVVSGPVLSKPASEYPFIGESKVAVPEFFYKAILVPIYDDGLEEDSPGSLETCADVIAIAFVIPNKACEGDFWRYAKSVDEAEEITGLDFFPLLEDSVENRAEAECDPRPWY